MNDELKILIGAGLQKGSQKSINEELQKLKLNSLKVDVRLVKDVQSSINHQLANLKLKSIDVNLKVNSKSIKDALKNTSAKSSGGSSVADQIFDVDKLKNEGRKFYLSATNIIDRVKNEFKNVGDVNIIDTRNAKKQLTGFTVEIRKLSGEIEKLSFKKAQFTKEGWGSKQSGFVFEKSTDVDKLFGTDMQKKLDTLNRMNNALENAKARAFDLTKPISDPTHINELQKRYSDITTEIKKVESSTEAMSKSSIRHINNMIQDADRLRKKYQEIERPAKVLESKTLSQTMAGYTSRFTVDEERWRQQGILVGDFQKRVEALKITMGKVGSKTDLHKFQVELEAVKAEAKKLNLEMREFDAITARKTASNKLSNFLKANPKVLSSSRQEVEELANSLSKIDTVVANSKWGKAFTEFKTRMEALGKTGQGIIGGLLKNMAKFSAWLISSGSVMMLVTTLKKMIDRVIDLDTQMTALRKVTDESSETYVRFFDSAADSAQRLGTTMSALIKSTGDFARLGYGLEDAKSLAEVANIYQNVGDIDIGSATESIISTIKAFNINAKESISIVDKFNEVNKPAPLRLVA